MNFSGYLAGWFGRLFDCCAFCGDPAGHDRICGPCSDWLPWMAGRPDGPATGACCERCGTPLAGAQPDGIECAKCQSKAPAFDRARAVFSYDFPVDAALKSIKFRRRLEFVPALACAMAPVIARDFPLADALVPVPLHRWRQMRRGFNQATELCRSLARETGLPVRTPVRRVRHTAPQAGLAGVARRRNLAHAFEARAKLVCRRPVIVDDVLTTGETCSRISVELRKAGARQVYVLTVARVC